MTRGDLGYNTCTMIYVAADKQGFQAIQFVEAYLKDHRLSFENLGVKREDEDIKLEDMIPPFAEKVRSTDGNLGILSCGTGVGVEVGVNKFAGIRACLVTDPKIAEWSKVYDNCNVLCLVGWETDKETVYRILDVWFAAQYDGDKGRLKMMEVFDTWH